MTDQREEMEAEFTATLEAAIDESPTGELSSERIAAALARLKEKYPEEYRRSSERVEAATIPLPPEEYRAYCKGATFARIRRDAFNKVLYGGPLPPGRPMPMWPKWVTNEIIDNIVEAIEQVQNDSIAVHLEYV